jgi:hypothetical protein
LFSARVAGIVFLRVLNLSGSVGKGPFSGIWIRAGMRCFPLRGSVAPGRGGVNGNEPGRNPVGGQLGLAARAGAVPHVAEMTLDRAGRDSQMAADLPARQAVRRKLQDLDLPGGQPGETAGSRHDGLPGAPLPGHGQPPCPPGSATDHVVT